MGVHSPDYFSGPSIREVSDETLGSLLSFVDLDRLRPGITLEGLNSAINGIANICCTDCGGNIVYANALFCEINKCELSDVIGRNVSSFNSGFHPPEFFAELWRTIRSGKVWRGEIRNRAMDGSLYWVDTVIAPRYDAKGDICGYVAVRMDITAGKDAVVQASKEVDKRLELEELLKDIIETLPNGVIAYGEDGRVLFYNKMLEVIYGQLMPDFKIGRRRQDIIARASKSGVLSPDGAETEEFDPVTCCLTHLQRLPNDHWIQVQNRKSPSGTLVSVQTDVTELKRIEERIAQLAETDALTGLLNRRALFERLSQRCQLPDDRTAPLTLIIVDLDHFKAINDSMGHDAGDALLCHVAKTFQTTLRYSDTVARLGGDEFAILLPDVHADADVNGVMQKLLAALAIPVQLNGQHVVPAASMGIARFPHDGKDPEALMKCADLALYQCKRQGRGGYRVYNLSMQRQRQRRALLMDRLRQALARNDFSVVLQPQHDISTGTHTGFEALVRWKVGRKWIAPQELISIAEEAGLITQVSFQLIDKALAIMARLKCSGLAPGTIGINVVAAQLHEPKFAESLVRLLRKHGLDPTELEIEVTENVIVDRSTDFIARILAKLHAKGVLIALDDFGMGYASLTHLKRFPLDKLKIDRSFVSGLLDEADDRTIVHTIISLAHSLGLTVVAEGIETPAQYRELFRLGCDTAQGYLIGRPMDEAGARDYLERNRRPGPLKRGTQPASSQSATRASAGSASQLPSIGS